MANLLPGPPGRSQRRPLREDHGRQRAPQPRPKKKPGGIVLPRQPGVGAAVALPACFPTISAFRGGRHVR